MQIVIVICSHRWNTCVCTHTQYKAKIHAVLSGSKSKVHIKRANQGKYTRNACSCIHSTLETDTHEKSAGLGVIVLIFLCVHLNALPSSSLPRNPSQFNVFSMQKKNLIVSWRRLEQRLGFQRQWKGIIGLVSFLYKACRY